MIEETALMRAQKAAARGDLDRAERWLKVAAGFARIKAQGAAHARVMARRRRETAQRKEPDWR
jgi:hypothetical protein